MTQDYEDRELYLNRKDMRFRPASRSFCKSSRYVGVTVRGNGRFMAQIKVGREVVYLGDFDSEVAAAMAYDAACDKHGGRRRKNFEDGVDVVSTFAKTEERLATEGDYRLESEACAAFDEKVGALSEYFHVEKEVQGWYVQPRAAILLGDDGKYPRPRIDRILHPRTSLLNAGWREGALGVEIKRSDVKAGSAVVQAGEYQRAVFDTPVGGLIMLKWVFLWPLGPCEGDIAVIMAQSRIGYCSGREGSLCFGCGTDRFLNFIMPRGGPVVLNVEQPPAYAGKIGGRTAKPVHEVKRK